VNWLAEFFVGALEWFGRHLSKLIAAGVSMAWVLFPVLTWVINKVYDTATALSEVMATDPGNDTGTVSELVQNWYNVGNVFFPLDAVIAYGTVLGTVWGTFTVYRLIKSWIPTVA